ncbi:cyclin-dependent kinase inhibitor 7-like [Impatiens glandulifera]|uniref:cyclin-dependent kinase inhibitor 7-like n=1 Tax=Impatiens glandulifera TaxID=253017 RepID=UPI001FB16B9C|nr:cyclin-dependent kinase inhibitor 7-like [Impatiens glandulifera]
MEVGHGMLRKRNIVDVDDTEFRSSRRRRKLDDPNFNNRSLLPSITSVEQTSTATSSSIEFKHGEVRSNELKNVSNRAESENSSTEISKPLISEKSTSSSNDNKRMKQQMPSMEEIESFFSAHEKHEQKRFSKKYNFDVVKDVPMEEGRYEWVKINPSITDYNSCSTKKQRRKLLQNKNHEYYY